MCRIPILWAPETNNISYCMPEPGMKAVLYLGTHEEKDGRVVLAGEGHGSTDWKVNRINGLNQDRKKHLCCIRDILLEEQVRERK